MERLFWGIKIFFVRKHLRFFINYLLRKYDLRLGKKVNVSHTKKSLASTESTIGSKHLNNKVIQN